MSFEIEKQRTRLSMILRRHVRVEDHGLTDDQFTREVLHRYEMDRAAPLIDPAE